MNKLLLVAFIIAASLNVLFGQTSDFQKVKNVFESFEHEKVIRYSDELLKENILSDSLLVEVYLMRAISFYAIGNENNSKNSFKEILKINKDFNPDPSVVSPKLITVFNEVKADFIKNEHFQENKLENESPQTSPLNRNIASKSTFLNLVLPGWGQFAFGNKTKGIIMSTISTAALASMIYYIYDTNKKENDYLNSYSENSFQEKYNAYNRSYKIRNTLIISYAAIWLFSQLDLLIFSNENTFSMNNVDNTSTGKFQINYIGMGLDIKIPF